jgi:PTS system N-acetylgalactosamine-specific IIA component
MAEDSDYAQLLADALSNVGAGDEVVVLADIAGGSPERLARLHLQNIGVADECVCGFGGANLPMALSAVMGIEDGLDLAAIGDALESEGQAGVRRL